MLFYKNRNTFLQKLHPASAFLLMLLYMGGMLLLNNPIYIALVIAWVLLLSYFDGCIRELMGITRYLLFASLFIIAVNPLVNHNGNTVLLYVKNIKLYVTLEAVIYGIVMAIRLYGITLVLGLSNMVMHPDRTFGFFSKFMGSSALLMSMTLRLFPLILTSCRSVVDAERMRGSDVREQKLLKRMKNQGSVVNILFMGCLEDAGDMAESMYSRGYGSGKRSTYFREGWSVYDAMIIALLAAALVLFIIMQLKGYNTMNYYPAVDNPMKYVSPISIAFTLIFGIPAIVNWGWIHGSSKS